MLQRGGIQHQGCPAKSLEGKFTEDSPSYAETDKYKRQIRSDVCEHFVVTNLAKIFARGAAPILDSASALNLPLLGAKKRHLIGSDTCRIAEAKEGTAEDVRVGQAWPYTAIVQLTPYWMVLLALSSCAFARDKRLVPTLRWTQ